MKVYAVQPAPPPRMIHVELTEDEAYALLLICGVHQHSDTCNTLVGHLRAVLSK